MTASAWKTDDDILVIPSVPASLFQKLAEITADIGHIDARGTHDFYGTKYVLEGDLVDAVRTKLTAKNVVMLPSVRSVDGRAGKTAKGKDTYITTVQVAFTFCDGDTGETYTCEWAGAGEDIGDKGLSKAYTGALRYFLLKAFLVPTGEGKPLGDHDTKPLPARDDGQNYVTDEQIEGIRQAWEESGADERNLGELLDSHNVSREIKGTSLTLSQRVRLLGALDGIKVQQALIEAKP